MARYQIQTDGGTFEVETDEGQPSQSAPSVWDYLRGAATTALHLPQITNQLATQQAQEIVQPNWTPVPTFGSNGRMTPQIVGQTPQEFANSGSVPAMIGAPLEIAGELLPRVARAGATLDKVASLAGDVPIDLTNVGNEALRTRQLASSGGSMPKVVRDFITRATDPKRGPITFAEGRDFYSNATRIAADEMNRLTPAMKRQLVNFTRALGSSLQSAAEQVGQGQAYQQGMNEYASASRLARQGQELRDFTLRRALPYAGMGAAATGAYELYHKLFGN